MGETVFYDTDEEATILVPRGQVVLSCLIAACCTGLALPLANVVKVATR